MTPDLAKLLDKTPQKLRTGRVFKLGDKQPHKDNVGKMISDIGQAAGVSTKAGEGGPASAHDLRRSFGTKWARKVQPAVLQMLMRHGSIETTMRFYVGREAEAISDMLWSPEVKAG